ncbi:sulfotransferase 1C4-like isoform X2 [Varroa jacobsoni]|uniref:Sulfotransferase domain-containing protein n=1 Tax=Varroa destructor TaxID=109461 RepID=A0A7M7MFC7_VARDE|nr:sulfotransferase 1C4-like isoform X1 [Varroa destructor]XP_022706157.1 sulfotransferase 1C4-like isoform X2 [Varroa jacobsoni]
METSKRNAGQEMFGDKMNGFQRRPSRPAEHKRMALFNVQGLVVSTDTCTRDQIRKVIWFKSLEKDIFVGSFPRAGGSWVQYIIWTLLRGTDNVLPTLKEMRTKYFPCIEQVDPDYVDKDLTKRNEGRLIHHHLPRAFVPAGVQKSIYIIRNPYDVCVSYYYYLKVNGKYEADFGDFFECFFRGEVPFGDYFDHIASWYEARDEPTTKILFYEQMMDNPNRAIVEIADFIGVSVTPEQVLEIASLTNLESLCGIETENVSREHYRYAYNGDWKKMMTEGQKVRLDELVEQFRYTDMYKVWVQYAHI